MFLAVLLITAITAIFMALNRTWRWRVCPICAGVSGSWLILTVGIVLGRLSGDYKLPIAILMGGTVVGIAFQGEARFDWAKKGIYMWKAPVIIFGMPIAYWLFNHMNWATIVIEIMILSLLIKAFFVRSERSGGQADSRRVSELEKKMKNCC